MHEEEADVMIFGHKHFKSKTEDDIVQHFGRLNINEASWRTENLWRPKYRTMPNFTGESLFLSSLHVCTFVL